MNDLGYTPRFLANLNDRQEPIEPITYLANKKRQLWLNTAVNENSAFNLIASIEFLSEKSSDPILLYINSPGGHVTDGMAIMDAMNDCGCDIITIATGMAASMGAFLLAAGAKGSRYATANAKILLHQPLGGAQGQTTDIGIAYKNIERTKQKLTEYLALFTGQSMERITADIDRDFWLTAEEALEYGVIDHIGRFKN
jgi:ATP-dependent Clp protease protease subunit